jgi:hypothetical protein
MSKLKLEVSLIFQILFHFLPAINNQENKNYITVPIEYQSSSMYVKVRLGTPGKEFNMLLDTMLTTSFVLGEEYKNSTKEINNKFKESDSNTMKIESTNFTVSSMTQDFTGDLIRDSFSLQNSEEKLSHSSKTSLSSTSFTVVKQITHSKDFSIEGYLAMGFTDKLEDNYVYQLYKDKKINSPKFATLLKYNQGRVEIHLGDYSTQIVENKDKLNFVDVNINKQSDENIKMFPWYLEAKSVDINITLSDKQEIFNVTQPQKIILNTAMNMIYMPFTFFKEYAKKIMKENSECQIWKNNYFYCKCNPESYKTDFATFNFNFTSANSVDGIKAETFTLKITPENYINIKSDSSRNLKNETGCLYLISPNYKGDYWVIGNNMLVDYYTIFDVEAKKVGFYNIDDKEFSNAKSVVIIVIIVTASCIAFFGILYLIYKKILARNIRVQQDLENIRNRQEGSRAIDVNSNQSNNQNNRRNNTDSQNNNNDQEEHLISQNQ